jgi:L-threonylcarbamoyladenylate synthase
MDNKVVKILQNGGVGVLLTDTLYGLVGRAFNKNTVGRIYKIKKRNKKKPLIILISRVENLKMFGIEIDSKLKEYLKKFWPGPTSIILPCKIKKFEYLHCGTKTLAFRLPKKNALIKILKKTGPLVAPSANPENLPPAQNIKEAKKYFGNSVDFYLKGGRPSNKASTVIKISNGNIETFRK